MRVAAPPVHAGKAAHDAISQLDRSMGEQTGFSGNLRRRPDADEVQWDAWKRTLKRRTLRFFVKCLSLCVEPRQRAGSVRVCSPRVQFYACRLPSVELQREGQPLGVQFYSVVVGQPPRLAAKGQPVRSNGACVLKVEQPA